MSIRGLPGHALMHAYQLTHKYKNSADRAAYLQRFGIEPGDAVWLYLGHTDLDNVSLATYGKSLREVLRIHSLAAIAYTMIAELEPLVAVIRQLGARPLLYGCRCHDELKKLIASRAEFTYMRCSACGGNEGEVIVAAPEPGPPSH